MTAAALLPAEQDRLLLEAAQGVFEAFRTSLEAGTLPPTRHTAMLRLQDALAPFNAPVSAIATLTRSGGALLYSPPVPPEPSAQSVPAAVPSGAGSASVPPSGLISLIPAADLMPGDDRLLFANGPRAWRR